MRWWALALAVSCTTPPCPDRYPLCVEDAGASCRAWSAGCCYGIVACAKGTAFADDAGSCAVIDAPAEKKVSCQ